jgi:FAD synthase
MFTTPRCPALLLGSHIRTGILEPRLTGSLAWLQLGIPTANIPADDLSEKHPELTTGVYYGVVALDPKTYQHETAESSTSEAVVLPAVLSIGYNPFYKNTVRSVVCDIEITNPGIISSDISKLALVVSD